jgi:hypothetical protein
MGTKLAAETCPLLWLYCDVSTHVPATTNASITMHRRRKHASETTEETAFSVCPMPLLYNEGLFVARGIVRELELENWVEFWRIGIPR